MLYRPEAFEPLPWDEGRAAAAVRAIVAGAALCAAGCRDARAAYPVLDYSA